MWEAHFKNVPITLPQVVHTKEFTQEEAEHAHMLHAALHKRICVETARQRENAALRARRAAKREEADVMDTETDPETLSRQMTWAEMLDPVWWETRGATISPTLHSFMFGFSEPSAMRDFFEVFFDEELKLPDEAGLTQYQLYALALIRMRRGWEVQFLAALTGANRPRLGPRTDVWIHRLGMVGKMLVGIPHIEYLLTSMPATFKACGMGTCCAIGDASDFMTETPRSLFLKKVRNMTFSDKMKHSCARGTTFCSAKGMNIIALALWCLVVALSSTAFAPVHASWRSCPPLCLSHMTKASAGCEASYQTSTLFSCHASWPHPKARIHSHHLRQCMGGGSQGTVIYVVEIAYKRVKEWHLLKEVVPSEKFHLMNSTWFWALGFGNLCLKFLQPPPDAETEAQRVKRETREASDARDAQMETAALRVAAEAAFAAAHS